MKAKLFFLPILLLLVLPLTAQVAAQVKDCKITVSGTSTLHDWTSEVTRVQATAKLSLVDGELKNISQLAVTIPVRNIKSSKGKTMDNNMYKALKSDEHANMRYTLTEVKSISRKGDNYTITTRGKLEIAGKSNTVDLTVKGVAVGNEIRFSGSHKMKMTDYGVTPPQLMLGTLKTGDDITVNFTLALTTDSTN